MREKLLEMAKAVRSAVSAVPVHSRGRNMGMGADGTPTSYIDKVAEDVILRHLDESDLKLNLLSEEAGFVDRGFADTLVADPVDGTFNACSGIPYYSVSLAVGKGSLAGIHEGLVMNLVTGDAFQASEGRGATLNGAAIRVRKPEAEKLLIAYLGSAADPQTCKVASRFKRVRCLGSTALELCSVAGGQADAFYVKYPDVKKSPRIVDIAAAVFVLREAGGQAYDENDEILDMPFSLGERRNMSAVGSDETRELMR